MNLILEAKSFARREREAFVSLLDVLGKLEETNDHLRAGYTSLFHFLTTGLLYSESSAAKRVRAVRIIKKFPEIRAKLLSRELTLSSLSLISSLLSEENFSQVMREVERKSRREVEVVVARLKAPSDLPVVKERIRPIVAKRVVKSTESDLFRGEPSTIKHCADLGCSRDSLEDTQSVKLKLSFSVKERVGVLMEEVKALLSHRYPSGATMEELFEEGLKAIADGEKRKRVTLGTRKARASREGTRHIPAKVKAEVLKRDEYCCSWRGKNNDEAPCRGDWGIELDHIEPFSRGGEAHS